jgi:thiamine-phosphate pyrophosphorylase
MEQPPCRLYLITPPQIDLATFRDTLSRTLDAGDVAAVQLRLKGVDDAGVAAAIDALRPSVQERGAAFVLNDRPDLARDGGCDGVHLGQDDVSIKEARGLLGEDAIIGATCHNSRHLAMEAAERGASYVAFGAFFPSATKDASSTAAPDILAWWNDITLVPCVAIGGITPENCSPLIAQGAHFLAVSASVWSHPQGPDAAVKAFNRTIEETPARCPVA